MESDVLPSLLPPVHVREIREGISGREGEGEEREEGKEGGASSPHVGQNIVDSTLDPLLLSRFERGAREGFGELSDGGPVVSFNHTHSSIGSGRCERAKSKEAHSSSPSFRFAASPLLLPTTTRISRMVSSMELENLASTSSGPIRATRDGASDEDDEDERSRMLSRTELDDSEDDDDEEGLKSLRRDLEKMEQEDEDEGSVESMVRKVSLLQRETRQEGREGSWLMLSSDQGGDGC